MWGGVRFFIGDYKLGFVELFDGKKLYISPHPSPVAFAGRHLPPKGKAGTWYVFCSAHTKNILILIGF